MIAIFLLLLLLRLLPCVAAVQTSLSSPNGRFLPHSKTCPRSCNDVSKDEIEAWSFYHDIPSLAVCPEPMILRFNLYMPFNDTKTQIGIRACTLGDDSTEENYLTVTGYVSPEAKGKTNFGPDTVVRRSVNTTVGHANSNSTTGQGNATCGVHASRETQATVSLASWTEGLEAQPLNINNQEESLSAVALAINKIAAYVQQDVTCHKMVTFAYVRGTLVGLFSGALVEKRKTSTSLLQNLADEVKAGGSSTPARRAMEVCDNESSASTIWGAVADSSGDFAAVQQIMKSWNDGKCVSETAGAISKSLGKSKVWVYDIAVPESIPGVSARGFRQLYKRAECRYITVVGGEDCPKLASRCGIAGFAFESFNKNTKNLCSTLQAGQPVCCSSGSLPDLKPKPDTNGICAVYSVEEGEGCKNIANKHTLKEEDLDKFNKKTWGWDGCDNLLLGQRICVSEGKPPMPTTYWDAQCGPTKPGSQMPKDGNMADINPCPLNVCCNVWGKCGTTSDFCTVSKTTTGNPGTSKKGENGCQSSCGTKIVNNSKGPAQYRKVAYFEGWNYNRACLNMHVLDIDKSYTHVHFAFGEISNDLQPTIPDDQAEQWNAFVAAPDFPKKVLAFGGWAFSNEGEQTGLFRKAFLPNNRGAFADKVVKFAKDHNLDGVDFDWEYPGATDIVGSDPGREEDGENYYQFLKLMREKLPKDVTLSIATPASYWYLRGFPVKKMAEVLDYIVYMTYDFHGQWDVGNKWAQPGCESGSCLRSHINATITHDSLVMITKAGVESHKIVVGVSSYGRSFKMADPNCRGPQCTYLGERNQSPAKKGRCTDTSGYISNFEINEIIKKGGAIKSWYDTETDSDYLVYDKVEWVAYMSEITKQRRMRDYKNMNFGGTSDWAVDLQSEGTGGRSGRPVFLGPEVYNPGQKASCQPPCVLVFPPSSLPEPTTIYPGKYVSSVEYGAMGPSTTKGVTFTVFNTKTTTFTVTIPPITVSSMSYSNVNITAGQKTSVLVVGPSISISPIPIKVPDGEGGTTTRTLILPPWPEVTRGAQGDGSEPTSPPQIPSRPPGWDRPRPTPPTTTPTELPTFTTYPPYIVTPIPKRVEEIEDEDDGFVTPCNLWFFNLCPNGRKDDIGGLKWILPPGIYPPGPPPIKVIGPPGPGPIITPVPPPWPPITVGRDNKPTFPSKPNCKTDSASFCSTTKATTTITVGPTVTTTVSTRTGCDTVYGCSLTDWATTVTTRTGVCALPTPRVRARNGAKSRRNDGCGLDLLVVPHNPKEVQGILGILTPADKNKHTEHDIIKSEQLNMVMLVLVYDASDQVWDDLERHTETRLVSTDPWDNIDLDKYPERVKDDGEINSDSGLRFGRRSWRDSEMLPLNTSWRRDHQLRNSGRVTSDFWAMSQISIDPYSYWKDDDSYVYNYDKTAGEGQYIYVLSELDYWSSHPEFEGASIEVHAPIWGHEDHWPIAAPHHPLGFLHGTMVAASVVGKTRGTCLKCNLVFVKHRYNGFHPIHLLNDYVFALDHIIKNKRQGKAVISVSFAVLSEDYTKVFAQTYLNILRLLEKEAKSVIVVSAGNVNPYKEDPVLYIDSLPALFGDPNRIKEFDLEPEPVALTNMIVVGASDKNGVMSDFTQYGDWIAAYAPGEDLNEPDEAGGYTTKRHGTSLSTPMVAGLAAYFRSLDSPWKAELVDPAMVKKMIGLFKRPILLDSVGEPDKYGESIVWNGQVDTKSCLSDYDTRNEWDNSKEEPYCPEIKGKLSEMTEEDWVPIWTPPGGSSGGGSGSKRIDWSEGPDSPKCPSGNCGGRLCRGYYCPPRPAGPPPDFRDPKDPRGPTAGKPKPGEDIPSYDGPGCAGYTTTEICDDTGGAGSCKKTRMCVATLPPCPALGNTEGLGCPSDYPVCGQVTYQDRCSLTIRGRAESQTGAPTVPTELPQPPSQFPRRHLAEQNLHISDDRNSEAEDDIELFNGTSAMPVPKLLGERQIDEPGCVRYSGCASWPRCNPATCHFLETLTCVQGKIFLEYGLLDSQMEFEIYEMGELTCQWKISCSSSKVLECLKDESKKTRTCGNGSIRVEALSEDMSAFKYYPSGSRSGYDLYFNQVGDTEKKKCYLVDMVPFICFETEWGAEAGYC